MKQFIKMFYGLMMCICLCSSCAIRAQTVALPEGSYTVSFSRSVNPDAVVYGRLYCFENKKALATNGAITMNNKIIARTDTNGSFIIRLKPGKYQLTGFGMPYQFLTIKPITVTKGDSVKIIMYLKTA